MKMEKNFTTGILSGVCGVLFVIILTGANKNEPVNISPSFEFYDLQDTKGLIFNKNTGEIKYEEIREKPLDLREFYSIDLNHSGYIQD